MTRFLMVSQLDSAIMQIVLTILYLIVNMRGVFYVCAIDSLIENIHRIGRVLLPIV